MANEYAGAQPGQGAPYYPAPAYYAQPNPYPGPQPYGGLQPAPVIYQGQPILGYEDRPRTQQENIPAYIFIALALLIIVLSAVALELHQWVEICNVDFGLTKAYGDGESVSLSSLKDDFCDFSIPTDTICGNMCTNMKDLIKAGNAMQGIGITSIVSSVLSIIRMVILLVRRRSCCKGLFARLTLVVAMFFWAIGTITYVSYYAQINNGASDSSIGPGLGLAIAVCVLQILKCIIGNIAISRLIQ